MIPVTASRGPGKRMRFLLILGVTALMSVASVPTMSAQTVDQPGQLGVSFQPRLGSDSAASGVEEPKTTVANVGADAHDRFMNRLWVVSMVSAMAGTGLDAASSWGQREGNALLASSDGRFEGKGLAIKAGLAAALVVPQICLRKRKNLKGPFAAANFTQAAIYTAVSVHNLQVR